MYSGITGISISLPEKVVNNDYFDRIGLTDQWIKKRSGIASRRWVESEEELISCASESINKLLQSVGSYQVDALIVSSCSFTRKIPALSQEIAGINGFNTDIFTVDLNAACSGYIYAAFLASALIESCMCSRVIVCTAEAMSIIIDKTDRHTSFLFGDACTATLFAMRENFSKPWFKTSYDYSLSEMMSNASGTLKLHGMTVYDEAIKFMTQAINRMEHRTDKPDFIIPHQANGRITKELKRASEKISILDDILSIGNTASSSIPVTFNDYLFLKEIPIKGRFGAVSFGAGATKGEMLMDYEIINEK